jgi:transcriptional regulator with XRE-family HTH domain
MYKAPAAGVIAELRAWRERNNLSQAGAVAVMVASGVPVLVGTLRRWEMGYRRPGSMAAKLLEEFLKTHPKVRAVKKGRYGRRAKTVLESEVKRIMELRASGKKLREIGLVMGLSESAVSRICGGSRHQGKGKERKESGDTQIAGEAA